MTIQFRMIQKNPLSRTFNLKSKTNPTKNNFEINSQYKPVKQNLMLQIPLTCYSSDTSSSRRSVEYETDNIMKTSDYTIELKSDVWSYLRIIRRIQMKAVMKRKLLLRANLLFIYSIIKYLSDIDKGKSNPHYHSISTKDPFHTIIKNIW